MARNLEVYEAEVRRLVENGEIVAGFSEIQSRRKLEPRMASLPPRFFDPVGEWISF